MALADAPVGACTSAQPVEKCCFFMIPPELRITIYEEVFALSACEDEVDITESVPASPSRALLLTCRQIDKEARGPYRDAWRRSWSTTRFCTPPLLLCGSSSRGMNNMETVNRVLRAIDRIQDEDIAAIKHFRALSGPRSAELTLNHGIWARGRTSIPTYHLVVPARAIRTEGNVIDAQFLPEASPLFGTRVYRVVDESAILEMKTIGEPSGEVEAEGLAFNRTAEIAAAGRALGRSAELTKRELKLMYIVCTERCIVGEISEGQGTERKNHPNQMWLGYNGGGNSWSPRQ